MKPTNLLAALSTGPLLCDGAMGTQLFARGLMPGTCGELWNVERPDAVEAIHRAYRQAGCDLITTNTFGASGPSLDKHSLADRVESLNRAGAQAAVRAAGPEGWVLGDIGPFGGFLEPVGDTKPEELLEIFQRQAAALYAGGADAIIVETMSDPEELAIAVKAAKAATPQPVIATYAFGKAGQGFRTMMGAAVDTAIRQAIDAGADVVGANCGTSLSLEDYLVLAEQIRQAAGDTPVILQPNAGSPHMVEGKLVYPASPQEMANLVPALLKLGLRIIGGCCGTSPDHLRAMAGAMKG